MKRKKVPLWLRRLDAVKAEVKTVQFPRTAQDGFRECVALSETALRWFRQSIRDNHPGVGEEDIEGGAASYSRASPPPKRGE